MGRETTDQIEIEANQFAAQLLVPDSMLDTGDHEATSEHKKDLATKFQVSEDIIGFRLGLRDDEPETDTSTQ